MTFGILTTNYHPLINGYLDALNKYKLSEYKVIIHKKNFSERNKQLLFERVGEWNEISEFNFKDLKDQIENKCIFINDPNSHETLKILKEKKLLFLLNCGITEKINFKTIQSLPMGIINVHPGNITKYRGQSSPEWALLNDDPIELTAHLMGEDYDQGPILMMKKCQTSKCKTYHDFRRLIYKDIFEISARATKNLLNMSMDELKNIDKNTYQNSSPLKGMPKEVLNDLINKKFKNIQNSY